MIGITAERFDGGWWDGSGGMALACWGGGGRLMVICSLIACLLYIKLRARLANLQQDPGLENEGMSKPHANQKRVEFK